MITHTIESYWIPSQKMTKLKLQILKIRQNFKLLNFETDITRDTPSEVAWQDVQIWNGSDEYCWRCRLMITHTIESYWIPSQKMTKSKLQILKIRQNFKLLNFETGITRDTPSEVAW